MPITNDEWKKIKTAFKLMRSPVNHDDKCMVYIVDVLTVLQDYREPDKGEEQ